MGIIVPGQMKKLYWVAESVYGTIPTGALTWGGETMNVKQSPLMNMRRKFSVLPGAGRSYTQKSSEAAQVGFNVRALARKVSGGYNWRNFWAAYAFGSTTGPTDNLGSFTAQIGKTVGATHQYNFLNGCKIDRLSIVGESKGTELFFDADIIAQWSKRSTSKTITGLQNVTVGADPTNIATDVLTWAGILQMNLGGGGLQNFHPNNWQLTVSNKLHPTYGGKQGADGNIYNVAIAVGEGIRDIIFDATVDHEGETYESAKLADTEVTALTIPIDTYTLTLSNGTFEAADFVELKTEDVMTESMKIRFKSLSIA